MPKESGKAEQNIDMVVAKFTSQLRKLERSAFAHEPQPTHIELYSWSETVLERAMCSPQAASGNPTKGLKAQIRDF